MKDLQKLKQQYEKLGAEIKALEEKPKRWRADEGKPYYYSSSTGEVKEAIEHSNLTAHWNYDIGNYFKTKSEAERYRYKQILLRELKDFAGENKWRKGRGNYSIKYDYEDDTFFMYRDVNFQGIDQVYFEAEERGEEAIEHFGDRLKLLL